MSKANGFTADQQSYLQGFALGSDVARKVHSLPVLSGSAAGSAGSVIEVGPNGASVGAAPAGPPAPGLLPMHAEAQNMFLSNGKKLSKEEQAKRDKNPLEMWGQIRTSAAAGEFPKGTDVFLYKFQGLFFVAPNQRSFMCRLRVPGGELKSWQFRGLADLAETSGGGYLDVTTRANLQIREIPAEQGPSTLQALNELGIVPRGSGGDNVRNVTAAATSGIDPQELIETLPIAKEMHHHILHHRELYGLPRKFNISFDGGGRIATLEDTNDIGFQAVTVSEETATDSVPSGIYYRLTLGGITGHKDFARHTGVLLTPEECVPVADAILRVFIKNGDRTDRNRARLKYVLDDWGFPKFVAAVEEELGRPFRKADDAVYQLPKSPDRWAHVGIHPQRQKGKNWIGVVLPVGRMTCEQVRGLADVADRYGSGKIRLTVWQNLILPDVAEENLDAAQAAIEATGLHWKASSVRSGLVACTGNAGCKFAAADTKGQAMALAAYLDERIELDVPINIHFTGCPNSCAQHYIGDIGFRGTKVERGEEMVEGYELVVGGGYADRQAVARSLFGEVAFEDVPSLVHNLLEHYLRERDGMESFAAFAARRTDDDLKTASGYTPPVAAA
ncbi:NirA family protein [Alienimonas californiensis]|uniref:Sulfite reductase [ferredoxin] n=1 Tax=Alienimonas californiensis TaxID=2527989 RepID=A0A517PDZ7_9PLAN|nr:NirA family protein [Alienimonas californiensis]QDT17600.1 Sulfite reductase [ferredoxin] [Alienimonas californiensis]